MQRRRAARAVVGVATAAGLVHAAASAYWAAGGRWLLSTVGQWAVELADRSPSARLALAGVALAKAIAALVSLAVAHGLLPGLRLWRGASWAGGSLLVLYGGANTVISDAVLAGWIRPDGGYDAAAMGGHAYLWDPLFLIWGAALLGWLRLSRPVAA